MNLQPKFEPGSDPRNDPRSSDELIAVILGDPVGKLSQEAIAAMQWRGTKDVLERAVSLCSSPCAVERGVGADILGQLGLPDRSFPETCLHTLLKMLEIEGNQDVLESILIALSHLHMPGAIGPASLFRHHADPDIRHAVVLALSGHEDARAIEFLIELTKDHDAHVRDWATFALGTLVDVDTTELRQALVERLADDDDDTRGEAFVGLAKRKNPRVLPALSMELVSGSVGTLAVEAAALIGDSQLHPLLAALQGWWDVDEDLLGEAVQACSPGAGLIVPGFCDEMG